MATENVESAKPRVLIVDDSRIVRATLIKNIKGRYDFREEADGEAGWAALLVDPEVQVVISDLGMPKLDGYGLLERIRSSPVARIRDVPFVIISGDEDENSRARAKELGATDFIAKGIGTAELLSRLESLVSLTKTREALDDSRELLLVDPVTGINTRKFVDLQVEQALAHSARYLCATSVLVIALDRVEEMRKLYGEALVGQLLLRFGKLLASKIRREESFGHYTQSSYAAVSPATDESTAQAFAIRLRDAVGQANVTYQGQRIPLSISIGIACTPPDGAVSPEEFLAIAAARMRTAAVGGNRFVGTGADPVGAPLPRLEHALALLGAGKGAEVLPNVARLTLGIMPLLRLADQECKLNLQLNDIESILRERAQAEKDARP